MKNISLTGLFIALMLCIGTQTSQAYYTTEQSALRVSEDTALYTITFRFGFAKEDVYIPVIAERTDINDIDNKAVGYNFTASETGDTQTGTSHGLVLSDMKIVDGMHKVPAGHVGYFTLVVALTLDEADAKAKYGLQVTNLPFTKVGEKGTREFNLGKPGLFAYHTKQMGLNRLGE